MTLRVSITPTTVGKNVPVEQRKLADTPFTEIPLEMSVRCSISVILLSRAIIRSAPKMGLTVTPQTVLMIRTHCVTNAAVNQASAYAAIAATTGWTLDHALRPVEMASGLRPLIVTSYAIAGIEQEP